MCRPLHFAWPHRDARSRNATNSGYLAADRSSLVKEKQDDWHSEAGHEAQVNVLLLVGSNIYATHHADESCRCSNRMQSEARVGAIACTVPVLFGQRVLHLPAIVFLQWIGGCLYPLGKLLIPDSVRRLATRVA